MYEDPKCFKNVASLQGKRPFTTFREIISENCLSDFCLPSRLLIYSYIYMNCVSKEIAFVSIAYDAGVNHNVWMLGNSVA